MAIKKTQNEDVRIDEFKLCLLFYNYSGTEETTVKHMHVNGIEDITLSGQRDGANRMGNSISLHLS